MTLPLLHATTTFTDVAPQSVHCATIAEPTPGVLLAACYAFSYETSPDSRILLSRFEDGRWGESETIVDYPGIAVGNPVLHADGRGATHLYFAVLNGEGWVDARIAHATSSDGGRTWGAAQIVHERKGLMTKGRPLLVGGRSILPVYDEAMWCSHVLVRDEGGDGWRLHGDTTARGTTIQPVVVPLANGRLAMYSRTTRGRIHRALSVDGGRSWTASQPTDLPNPNSGIEVLKTAAGALLLVYNPLTEGRHALAVAVSRDDGASWSEPLVIDEVDGELSYPYAIEDAEGRIQLLYTRQRTEIVHVAFDPADVVAASEAKEGVA